MYLLNNYFNFLRLSSIKIPITITAINVTILILKASKTDSLYIERRINSLIVITEIIEIIIPKTIFLP